MNSTRTIILTLGVGLLIGGLAAGCGRTLSRFGLGSQKLQAPKNAQQVLNVAFHKAGGATVKDVVFLMNDCTVIAKEYKDVSPFEGEMRFVAHDGKPFLQAGCVPR